MASSKEDIVSNLRAIIISSKGGLKLSDVRADYREAFGVDIPLKTVGYSSLENFFKSNPQDFTIVGNTVQAVIKSSSVHIVSLVNRQKKKKKGRSKLSSKQARNLRKPNQVSVESAFDPYSMRTCYSAPSKISKQDGIKNNFSIAIKETQDVLQKTAPKKPPQIIQKPALAADKSPEDKSISVLTKKKKIEEQKGNKHQKASNLLQPGSKKRTSNEKQGPLCETTLFKDFEDLKPSDMHRMKLPVEKVLIETALNSQENPKESLGSPPPSPFTRSLVNTTKEEILLAKKTAQIRLNNNSKPLDTENKTAIDLTFDLEEDSNYEQKLKQFCIERGIIMPTFSLIIKETFNKPKCYGCELSIGDSFTVSTYPVETHSEVAARELASKKAYYLLTLNNNLPPKFLDTDFVIKLRTLCSQKNLPDPIFKSIECRPKNEPGYFISKVRIGEDILLSSYPEEVRDEISARDLAAKKAYEYLLSDNKSSSVNVSRNDNVTLTQIFNILKTKEYGVWSNKLASLYMDTYSEVLPPNWFELIKNSPQFEVNHVERAGFIVRAKTDTQVAKTVEEPLMLASLKVPESNQWEVYITNVINSGEVWCRLIGKDYSELYDSMMTKLELQPPTLNVENPVVGEIYLINLEESWNRVELKEVFLEKKEAMVFLIDLGVDEVVKLSQLFYLQKSFFLVPPQAILLSLNELDSLAECEELQSAMFHSLLGNTFIAEVVAISGEGGNVSSVILWDTSTEEDVNINLKLLDDVIRTIKGPSLPSVGLVREMYVSYVGDNGDVYLQTSKKNADFVDKIISLKFKNSGKLVPMSNKIDPKKLYITCNNENGLYYRAKLSNALEDNFVLVKFIDVGEEHHVAVENLFDLEQTSLDLAMIPSQAVRVIISGLGVINSKVLTRIRDCILNQSVLVKATQISVGGPPYVELFIRSQLDGTLSSVCNKITSDEKFPVVDVPTRKKSYVMGLESTLSNDLSIPNIPSIGSYFNVIVTLAAHPNLFIVQPLATQNGLMELMFRLQEKCDASFLKPLSEDEFKIGNLYAVKHDDGYWYRAYAHAIVSPSNFTVYLCDFGDLIIVSAEKLMPLFGEFKTFPYQAIRAYLAGITPVNKDWSPLDCVKFREMVVEKQFVSQVVEVNRDVKNPNFITLGLILVDTTTTEDVYIHKVLIEKNMAVAQS